MFFVAEFSRFQIYYCHGYVFFKKADVTQILVRPIIKKVLGSLNQATPFGSNSNMRKWKNIHNVKYIFFIEIYKQKSYYISE